MNKEYRAIKFRAWNKATNMMYEDILSPRNWSYNFLNTDIFIWLQWTGLKDKNNKDIYEGDWCSAKFRTKDGIQVIQGKIIMDEYMWCIDCTGCVGDDIFSINRPHTFEVIGNIYQNPELLNTKQ